MVAVWGIVACGGEASIEPAPRRLPNKAALFGDASLVPTRTGERIRLELADAAAIEEAVDMLPSLRSARVDVRRPAVAADPPRVLVTGELHPDADEVETRTQIERIVGTVLGAAPEPGTIVLVAARPTPPREGRRLDLLLGLAILGLGVSAGVAGERYATMRRLQAARGRRRPR